MFFQGLEEVALPFGLQSLTFDTSFNLSLEKVALPSGLLSLTFGASFRVSDPWCLGVKPWWQAVELQGCA